MSFFRKHVTGHLYDFLIPEASKIKVYNVTIVNTRNLKGILTFILQTHKVLVYWTMSFLCRHVTEHFYDFLILEASKTKVYNVTTSNTKNFMGILTFILQTHEVLVY